MQHQQHPHQSPFLTLYDHSPPPRAPPASSLATINANVGHNANVGVATLNAKATSIWAPQPQASEAAWPRALEAFSRSAVTAPITREDVFGPLASLNLGVGAVGVVGDRRSLPNESKSGSESASPDLNMRADTVRFFISLRSPFNTYRSLARRAAPSHAEPQLA
jgi:hypothetical protein